MSTRQPKIYVVVEEPYHDNSTLRLATLDIDQAFAFAQKLFDEGKVLEYIEISELEGEEIHRAWHIKCYRNFEDPLNPTIGRVDLYGEWFQVRGAGGYFNPPRTRSGILIASALRPAYEHIPGGRKERLIEAAEIVMNLAIEDVAP